MLTHRLECLKIFRNKSLPTWGPNLANLDLESICYFATPETTTPNARTWDDVPDTIKNTFEALGIPEAERQILAGV